MAANPQDRWVFLCGRPPMQEFLGFVKQNAADEADANMQTLSDEWRAANDRINQLVVSEPDWANNPTIGAIPEALRGLVDQVANDSMYRLAFQVVPTTIGMVELDRLVVYQKHINLTYADELIGRLGAAPTEEEVFRLCLPIDHPQPPLRRMRTADNAFVFVSPSMDIRFLDSLDFDATRIDGYVPRGPGNGTIGIVVGYGSNYLNAISANNRLVLNNGSHRAYALRAAGVTHVPCIIQQVTRSEELPLVCPAVANSPADYLVQARPSVLKDYFDPALGKTVNVWRKFRQVRVIFNIEVTDVPGV